MRLLTLGLTLLLILAACGPGTPTATPLPTIPPIEGTVDILEPQEGTVIYAESVVISGTASDVPDTGFLLKLVDAAENTIAETLVHPDGDTWQVELVHGYTGDPTEVIIYALPANTAVIGDYDIASVAFSSLEFRPEGIFGFIFSPSDESVIGGDLIEVTGMASGMPDNKITVVLENGEGVIDEQIINVSNPNYLDEVPWTAHIATGNTVGAATLKILATDPDSGQITLDSINVTVGGAAG